MKNIVVVGAGFAGWMTALYARHLFRNSNIMVIGSKEIGILGAGEGTVPQFQEFFRKLEIDPDDVIRYCKATLKYGIRFDNWKKDGSGSYISAFRNEQRPNPEYQNLGINLDFVQLYAKLNDLNIDDYLAANNHLIENKVLFDDNLSERLPEIIGRAYHFDANDIAEFLSSVALSRNIQYIDDIVTDFVQSDDGRITKINTKNYQIDVDFVFDCTGFKRLIIGKLYNSEFVSVRERLPVNTAIPFFLPPKEEVEPYTTARAMKYGWCWKIPLQHRYGCGYVFDNTTCDIDQAKKEIIDVFGQVEINRNFSFEAGYYSEVWKKNCIAIGLSGSFIEPLEATSIWLAMAQIQILKDYIIGMETLDQYVIDKYNGNVRESIEHKVDYLQFHYLNGRSDTLFWKKINTTKRSDKLIAMMKSWMTIVPENYTETFYPNSFMHFNQAAWLAVGNGIDAFNKTMIQKNVYAHEQFYTNFTENTDNYRMAIKNHTKTSITHQEYLNRMVGKRQYEKNRKLIFK